MSNLTKINTLAPRPYMINNVANQFNELRKDVYEKSGVDFLMKCGDVYRDAGFVSKKEGVANRSNHKAGRAFDYDQTSKHIYISKEPKGGKMYFRTFIKCIKQDGSLGKKQTVNDYRGHSEYAYFVDFTKLAESFNFSRIPAWNGWEKSYNRREFWHYQDMIENGRTLTWDEAMLLLKGKTREPDARVYGKNDRGPEVKRIQQKLADLGILPNAEIDGIFGVNTHVAVMQFQKEHKLSVDGLIGLNTWKVLFKGE